MNALHVEIAKVAAVHLGCKESALRSGASVHTCASPVHFRNVSKFKSSVLALADAPKRVSFYIGCIQDRIHVSVRLDVGVQRQATTTESRDKIGGRQWFGKRKRRDDEMASKRAEDTVAALRVYVDGLDETRRARACECIERAKYIIERVLVANFSDDGKERVLESCALTMRTSKASADCVAEHEPLFIVASRFATGVALSLDALQTSLADAFSDGILTTQVDRIVEEFRLPAGPSGSVTEALGQQSLLCFASVR